MGFVRGITGKDQARAAEKTAETQAAAGALAREDVLAARDTAQGFFEPFAGAAQRGVEESQFLADPQAQFDFLQDNPLFNLALENANQRTLQSASANRRLSFGDTLQQLSNNVLLQSAPLIDRQREDVTNLLQFGGNIAGNQANIETGQAAQAADLTTDIGAATAAGQVGSANARAAGAQNLLSTALTGAGAFLTGGVFPSDERLKTNKKLLGNWVGFSWWSWDWNELAGELFGLYGSDSGVMAQEVIKTRPDAVIMVDGIYKVNYGVL